jgi:hypothetical protein
MAFLDHPSSAIDIVPAKERSVGHNHRIGRPGAPNSDARDVRGKQGRHGWLNKKLTPLSEPRAILRNLHSERPQTARHQPLICG